MFPRILPTKYFSDTSNLVRDVSAIPTSVTRSHKFTGSIPASMDLFVDYSANTYIPKTTVNNIISHVQVEVELNK